MDWPLTDNSGVWDFIANHLTLEVVGALLQIGLFDKLPLNDDEIGKQGILGPKARRSLIPALICDGYLVKLDGKYYMTPFAQTYLTRRSEYSWSDCLNRFMNGVEPILKRIKEDLKNIEEMHVPRHWNKQTISQRQAENFVNFMNVKSAAPADGLAASVNLGQRFGTRKLLDVAGGSGRYAKAIFQRHSNEIECALLELPIIAKVAQPYLDKTGISILKADIMETLPQGFDTHLFADTIHMFSPFDVKRILENSFMALPPGGTILISNAIINDDLTGPRNAVYFYVYMFLTGAGQTYVPREFRSMLEAAGFINVQFLPYYSHYTLISAKKPRTNEESMSKGG